MTRKLRTTLTEDGIAVELADMDDWDEFVRVNRDAIESDYGSVDRAFRHCIDGGLRFGGGAMPIVDVYFEM